MEQQSFQSQLTNDLRFVHGRGAKSYNDTDGLILLTRTSMHVYIGLIKEVNNFENDITSGMSLDELKKKHKHFLSSVDFEDIKEIRDAASYTEQGIIKIFSKKEEKPVISFAYGNEYFRGYIPLWFGKNGLSFPTVIEKQSVLQRAFPLILGAISIGVLIYLWL